MTSKKERPKEPMLVSFGKRVPHIEFSFSVTVDGKVLKPQSVTCEKVMANEVIQILKI